MKCIRCGNVVGDNDKFCPQCGSKIVTTEVQPKSTATANNADTTSVVQKRPQNVADPLARSQPEEEKSALRGCIIGLLVIVLLIGVVFGIVYAVKANEASGGNSGGIVTRSSRTSDISCRQADNFSLTLDIEITALYDIKDLQVTFKFMDSSGAEVRRVNKYIGTVTKGSTYTVSISELGLSGALSVRKFSYEVTGGRTSI